MGDIDGPDKVILSPNTSQYTVEEGNSLTPIACGCGQCNPNCTSLWMFNSRSSAAGSNLYLNDVSRNSSGQYSCYCINTDTFQNKSEHIDVIVECKQF